VPSPIAFAGMESGAGTYGCWSLVVTRLRCERCRSQHGDLQADLHQPTRAVPETAVSVSAEFTAKTAMCAWNHVAVMTLLSAFMRASCDHGALSPSIHDCRIVTVVFGRATGVIRRQSVQAATQQQAIADEHTKVVRGAAGGMGGIRDVFPDGTQEFYAKFMAVRSRIASGAERNIVWQGPRFAWKHWMCDRSTGLRLSREPGGLAAACQCSAL